VDDDPWYETLRHRYKPPTVRVLLVAESVPDPLAGDRRFFYNDQLTGHDNLFRGVALAQYGLDADALRATSKTEVLHRLQNDGFWLIDTVSYPVNRLGSSERRRAIREAVPMLIERTREAQPSAGVFICTTPIHKVAAGLMRAAGVTVLNTTAAPFPLGNTRAEFVRCWRRDIPAIVKTP